MYNDATIPRGTRVSIVNDTVLKPASLRYLPSNGSSIRGIFLGTNAPPSCLFLRTCSRASFPLIRAIGTNVAVVNVLIPLYFKINLIHGCPRHASHVYSKLHHFDFPY